MQITGAVNPKSPYTFNADGMKIGKGGEKVEFTVGEYALNDLAPLFLLQGLKEKTFTVTVQVND